MKKYILFLSFLLIFSLSFGILAFAHGGRTDAYGGHRDNNNVSGLGYYHFHCGGHPAHLHENGVCPYDTYVPEETINYPSELESEYYYESDYETSVTLPLPTYSYTDSDTEENDTFTNISILCIVASLAISFIAYIAKGGKQPENTSPQKNQKPLPLKAESYSATQKTDKIEILNAEPSDVFFNKSLFDTYFEDLDEDIPDYNYKIPAGTIIFNDGLPADIGAERHWGKTYTVYVNMNTHIYHKGSCRYVKSSTCYPEHIIHASKMCTPCKVCKPQMPDLDWYFEAQKPQKKL